MADLVLLWHMHQPRYVHPDVGEPVLPWVRLHAASGYLDMARALERRPGARVTVNFVPSLVEQIEAMLAGARDPLERIADKPTDSLEPAERRVVLARSFSVRWDRAVAPRPRYRELHQKRGDDAAAAAVAKVEASFDAGELRDLECLFLLSWLGFAARQDEPGIGALDDKGRDFSEADKAFLLGAVRAAAAKVLPAWRALAASGQVELCTSPYYHPIVPLLVSSDTARRSRPADRLPPRFSFEADARTQIAEAMTAHARTFGAPPKGMWPPEGSLSPEAVRLYHEAGVTWLAGDEGTLARSLAQNGAGPWHESGAPRRRVWRHEGVALLFRDRELSDRIGFRYADIDADSAADDLIASARAGAGDDGVCAICLDGENAWESYPGRGAAFLDALYARLERETHAGTFVARTMSEAVAHHAPRDLPHLHSGSWIDADFHIWIGDPVKNRAWTLLGRLRERLAVAERTRPGAPGLDQARRLLLIAEGSDWFWWFGEPFYSLEDGIFDDLFRAHLAAAYAALGEPVPPTLSEPVGSGLIEVRASTPRHLIAPRMDGRKSFYEWQGAARVDLAPGQVMAGAAPPVSTLLVGFDLEQLFLCLDPARGDRRRVGAAHMALHVRLGERELVVPVILGAADGGPELRAVGGRIGTGDVVELALPFSALGASPRDELRVWMTLEFAGVPLQRLPPAGACAVTVPWPGFDDDQWSV